MRVKSCDRNPGAENPPPPSAGHAVGGQSQISL